MSKSGPVLEQTSEFLNSSGVAKNSTEGLIYPPSALDYLKEQCGLGSSSLIIDVGCGISTSWLAGLGSRIVGIELSDEPKSAQKIIRAFECPRIEYRKGSSNKTGLAAKRADLVIAVDAFHSFDPLSSLEEFYRILRCAGSIALVWNLPDESHVPTCELLNTVKLGNSETPLGREISRVRQYSTQFGAQIVRSGFEDCLKTEFMSHQELNLSQLLVLSRANSNSLRQDGMELALVKAFQKAEKNGRVSLHFRTVIITARKPCDYHKRH